MSLLEKYLLSGSGISVYSQEEYASLMEECYKLGFGWKWTPLEFSTRRSSLFIKLFNGRLFWGKIEDVVRTASFELYDWVTVKGKQVSEITFVY